MGSLDSTSVAPSRPPRMVLISAAAAVTMGTSVRESRGRTIDSRITPRRMPASAPGVPGVVAWLA